uniref:Uncharacterized protein n=1 Tax=Rhizophagus irregularis (strain DAOM 181602 / DAOM 197198 / MUCL 43194) TaxID=747089 RepID=U9TS83_RHIID
MWIDKYILLGYYYGLLELQNSNIVYTELAPKNIIYFQKEKDGCTENWKLIDLTR